MISGMYIVTQYNTGSTVQYACNMCSVLQTEIITDYLKQVGGKVIYNRTVQ